MIKKTNFSKKIFSLLVLGIFSNVNAQVFELDKPPNKEKEEVIIDLKQNSSNKDDVLFVQDGNAEKPIENLETFSLAIQSKKYEKIEEYLKNGSNINTQLYDGNTIVNLSSFHRDTKLLQYAFDKKANLNNLNKAGESILYWGGAGDKIEYLELIKSILPPKEFDLMMAKITKNGRTPLHAAVAYKANIKIIDFLIANKVNLEIKDINGQTALHYAAAISKWDALEEMLKKGGNIKEIDNSKQSVEDYIFMKVDMVSILKFYSYVSEDGKRQIEKRVVSTGGSIDDIKKVNPNYGKI